MRELAVLGPPNLVNIRHELRIAAVVAYDRPDPLGGRVDDDRFFEVDGTTARGDAGKPLQLQVRHRSGRQERTSAAYAPGEWTGQLSRQGEVGGGTSSGQ